MKTIALQPISQTELEDYLETGPQLVDCISADIEKSNTSTCPSASIFMLQNNKS